jgi:alpha,alpha-trehalase
MSYTSTTKNTAVYHFKTALLIIVFFWSCQPSTDNSGKAYSNFYETTLFKDVQLSAVFPDSKTFADAEPVRPLKSIVADYETEKIQQDFDLKRYVEANFELPVMPASGFTSDTSLSMEKHIESLWPVLTREPNVRGDYSSLIVLPESYIVPGGRFGEIYYWDSYFTMLGLIESDKIQMVENMIGNFSYLIDSLGFIPNGNRNYFLGRSQPPFYSHMVALLEEYKEGALVANLPFLEQEYRFWMDGFEDLSAENREIKRVVMVNDSTVLNRYWDSYNTPRPESYKEDVHLSRESNSPDSILFRHLRAACESGWDFSSRWLRDAQDLSSIYTTDIIPVDLNCLLFHLEKTISKGYEKLQRTEMAERYAQLANDRKVAILNLFWNEQTGFFHDFDWVIMKHTATLSMAGVFPLFTEIATDTQAEEVSLLLANKFLKPGGFVTTLNETGQQWDAPNGWAPLQWVGVKGLANYGIEALASEAAGRWLSQNELVFKATGKMVEKYDVLNQLGEAGGGEYPLQDGFGWSNGVAIKMISEGYTVSDAIELESNE